MIRVLPLLGLSLCTALFGDLQSTYAVEFGNPHARITVTEYYSFTCKHCIELFKRDFPTIQKEWIDTGKVRWIFYPKPIDTLTIQGMECYRLLTPAQKKLFFEALMEEIADTNSATSLAMMQKAMEIFGRPIPDLNDLEKLEKSQVYRDAFAIINETQSISGVPTIEIDGIVYDEYPDKTFVHKTLKELEKRS